MAIDEINEAVEPRLRVVATHAPETAFVLGGGGNLGAIQVGQLRALIERDIVPDAVIGCSVGSLNGAAIAGEPTVRETERLAELWKSLGKQDIFPSPSRTRGPWLFIRNGLSAYSDHGLKNVIAKWMQVRDFADCMIPFYAVATALHSGLEHWFHRGDLVQALLASTALPGFLPPVRIEDEDFIDGGVVNNVPVSKAYELGVKRIYVLDVGLNEREQRAPKRPYEVLMQAITIARAHRFRSEMSAVPADVELVRMPTVDPGKLRFDDFSRSAELIERAHRVSAAFLEKMQEKMQDKMPPLAASA
jgi:NTE family protein